MNGTVRRLAIPPPGAYCSHVRIRECHPGCGHWSCPCGVSWDDWGEGGVSDLAGVRRRQATAQRGPRHEQKRAAER